MHRHQFVRPHDSCCLVPTANSVPRRRFSRKSKPCTPDRSAERFSQLKLGEPARGHGSRASIAGRNDVTEFPRTGGGVPVQKYCVQSLILVASRQLYFV